MILCEWDAPDGDPGQNCVHLFARILSTSFTSVSIFSVCCYSSVSISMLMLYIYLSSLAAYPYMYSVVLTLDCCFGVDGQTFGFCCMTRGLYSVTPVLYCMNVV
jgi:hypothetical protein